MGLTPLPSTRTEWGGEKFFKQSACASASQRITSIFRLLRASLSRTARLAFVVVELAGNRNRRGRNQRHPTGRPSKPLIERRVEASRDETVWSRRRGEKQVDVTCRPPFAILTLIVHSSCRRKRELDREGNCQSAGTIAPRIVRDCVHAGLARSSRYRFCVWSKSCYGD